jgi:demethylmenaquinone methyltransferase/2-methoxy-6-polyprenyl-1,4-benzoquinol methylase
MTISFGLRNMTNVDGAIAEMFRCLKPGGQLVCLEFSTPVFWLKPFYDFYSWAIIPRLGAFVAREPAAYQYLIESIRKFPDQHELSNQFQQVGFKDVKYKNLSFGISALHYGTKPTNHK